MRVSRLILCSLLTATAVPPAPQQPTIRADVNLVQLQATVTDASDHPVFGLGKAAFRLFVDDMPQEITVFQGEDAPVTAGIVIDNSASMRPKQGEVIAAALAFARGSNPKDQMFVVHFSGRPRFGLPEGERFTGDLSQLEKAVSAFHFGGTTALYDALVLAESQFLRARYSRKVILTITDGGDNSSQASFKEALDGAVQARIMIYSIGIFDESNRDQRPEALSKLAQATGGRAFFSSQVSDIPGNCSKIAREIRNQYTLGFPGAEDGQFHRVRVTATAPRYGPLEVHTRNSYMALKPSSANRSR